MRRIVVALGLATGVMLYGATLEAHHSLPRPIWKARARRSKEASVCSVKAARILDRRCQRPAAGRGSRGRGVEATRDMLSREGIEFQHPPKSNMVDRARADGGSSGVF